MELLKPMNPMEPVPPSDELPTGVVPVRYTDEPRLPVNLHPNVVYDERDGETLHLQILTPFDFMPPTPVGGADGIAPTKYPLIVHIPGSAWHRQMVMMALSSMIRVCERGFAVAIMQYRPSEVAGFPAQIEDAKTAIRFMRKHATEYGIDPDSIAIWGDSSGGHTALMTAITGAGTFDNGTYSEFDCDVSCVVDCFGPTDISKMNYYPTTMDHIEPDSPEGYLIGRKNVLEHPELVAPTIVMNHITPDKRTPPIIILHGDRDQLVPFNQSCMLYDKLKALGKTVEMYKLLDGSHGAGGFNSSECLDIILEFVERYNFTRRLNNA